MTSFEDFRTAVHDPNTWITRSIGLFQSAETVWEAGKTSAYRPGANHPPPACPLDELQCFGFYKVAMMLYGLAVETALKGMLIAQSSDAVRVSLEMDGSGKVLSVSLKTTGDAAGGHDLVALAKQAGVISRHDLQDCDAKKHLRELSGYVVWRGRYPVPKSLSAVQEERDRGSNVETVEFTRAFLRTHLKRPA